MKTTLFISLVSLFSTTSFAQGEYSYLISKHSDKCLAVSGSGMHDGARALLWECLDQTNFKWKKLDTGDGDGSFYLRAWHSDKCLAVSGGHAGNGAEIVQWTCLSLDNFKWTTSDAGNGYFYLTAKHSNRCVGVDASLANTTLYSPNPR